MFKVGDKVRNLTAIGGITKGKVYIVEKEETQSDINFVYVIDDNGKIIGWRDSCFELVKEENMFKVGDKVRCINDYDGRLTIGQIYTVTGLTLDDNPQYTLLYLKEYRNGAFARRFELVKDENTSIEDYEIFKIWGQRLSDTQGLRDIYDFGVEHGKNPPVQKWYIINTMTEQKLGFKGYWYNKNITLEPFKSYEECLESLRVYTGLLGPNGIIVIRATI